MPTYYVFERSCKNWQEFASAEKKTIETGLSYDEAREICQEFNKNRTDTERENGTMYEFTTED